jgi:translation elongation factor EF-Tu-like GTPase
MTVREVVAVPRRPGVYLAGKIESGVVRIGDRLELLDGDTVFYTLTCEGIEFIDYVSEPERSLVAVHCVSLQPGEVRKGQVLAGTEHRPPQPQSMSAPLAHKQTAAASTFAMDNVESLLAQAKPEPPA